MSQFKIYPLGGVGEIGSNSTVLETANHVCVIDCGILFPYEDFYDLNYLIVDMRHLQTLNKPIHIFITHGHEDHIGAIHHYLDFFPEATIYAPLFAKELIDIKLERRKTSHPMTIYTEDSVFEFDECRLTPVHVTHSIPGTFGVIITHFDTAILFISDFKYDFHPSFEEPFNVQKIKNIFQQAKKTYAFIDSTNILVEQKTTSESELIPAFQELLSLNKRTFITLFSSNIYRLKNILQACKDHKRKVTSVGRSIQSYLQAAEESQLLELSEYPYIDFESIQNYSDPSLVYIVTGSQGEHLGAAKRIISGEQRNISLSSEDIFVFSSKPIPGNEKKITRLYNQLASMNVQIVTSKDMLIHASGHPGRADLRALITEVQPQYYIPIHGETYFLRKHIAFINKEFPSIKTIFIENFQGIEFNKDREPEVFKLEVKLPIIIHGDDIILERERISERRKLATTGLVVIGANHKTQLVKIECLGLPNLVDSFLADLRELIDFTLFVEHRNRDYDYCVEQVRIKTRAFFKAKLGYKPVTIVQLH